MRSIAEYTTRILEHKLTPPGEVARSAHERAARRAATRSDATVARVITELAAEPGFLELPVGRVDAESWAAREELARRATERLDDLVARPGPGIRELLADHVALDLEARYPALTDELQATLAGFELAWGYRQSFAVEPELPGLPHSGGVVFALQRETGWPADRIADGIPSNLGPRADSRTHRVPDHVTITRHRGLPLVELSMWPHADDATGAGWVRVGLALQDRARLVPFTSEELALVDPGFVADLVAVVVDALDRADALRTRERAVFSTAYQRDGMPVPRWRDAG